MNDQTNTGCDRPLIWNPNAAANWSLIFSPAFGAILHAINWKALGQPDKAKVNRAWARGVIVFLLLLSIIPPNIKIAEGIGRMSAVVLLLTWYFSQGRAQAKYVKETYGKEYHKRRWANPLLIGLACLVGYVIFSIIVALIYSTLLGIPFE